MCGGGGQQEVTQRVEIDPALRRFLYGGTAANPRGGFMSNQPAAANANANAAMNGGGGGDNGYDPFGPMIAAANVRRDMAGSDPGAAGFGGTAEDSMAAGGMYAMGGYVSPQMGIASLNQGQMPMMNGSLPNLSDPMTAATLAMAMQRPQSIYGAPMSMPMNAPMGAPMGNPMMPGYAMGGYIEGPGTGRSDSVRAQIYQNGQPVQEARLSDGEFVMTENAVRGAGNGDREAGAARMYEMMRRFERGGMA
jgi:hypothetical protein